MKTFKGTMLTLVVGLIAGGLAVFGLLNSNVVEEHPVSSDSKVIDAVERREEIVLVSLGIQGIHQESNQSSVFGIDIPGTGRNMFLQYNYSAKLGIDGEDVKIRRTGESAYTITIPDFEFIGHDDVSFQTILENNGLLSWTNAEIDESTVITQILDEETMQEQVENNRELLESQVQSFYTDIIKAVEPDAKITFVLPESPAAE